MTKDNVYLITVSLDYGYSDSFASPLPGMFEASAAFVKMAKDRVGRVYCLQNSMATRQRLLETLRDVVNDSNCKFLIFHYSGHGTLGGSQQGIWLYDGAWYEDTFWTTIKSGRCRKVMTVFDTCFGGGWAPTFAASSAGSSSIDHVARPYAVRTSISGATAPSSGTGLGFFQDSAKRIFGCGKQKLTASVDGVSAGTDEFQILCWAPCRANEESWVSCGEEEHPGLVFAEFESADDMSKNKRMEFGGIAGSYFARKLAKHFSPDITYKQLWEKICDVTYVYGYKSRYNYQFGGNGTAFEQPLASTPTKTVIGQSFEDEIMFSSDGSGQVSFTVTFKDYDGTVLKEQTVQAGQSATPPEDPVREGYEFKGWDNSYDNVTKDTVCTAQYEDVRLVYWTVTFLDYAGRILSQQEVLNGEDASPPFVPAVEGKTFSEWKPPCTNIRCDTACQACYREQTAVYYSVTFKDWDGTLISVQTVKSGNSAVPPDDPQRTGYEFIGWNNSYLNVVKDTVCTAQYKNLYKSIVYGLTESMLSSDFQVSGKPVFYFALKKNHEKSQQAKRVIESLSSYANDTGIVFVIHEGENGTGIESVFDIGGVTYPNDAGKWLSSDSNYFGHRTFGRNNFPFVARSFPSMQFFYRNGDEIAAPMLFKLSENDAEKMLGGKTFSAQWPAYGYVDKSNTISQQFSANFMSNNPQKVLVLGKNVYYKYSPAQSDHYYTILRGDGTVMLPTGSQHKDILQNASALSNFIQDCFQLFPGWEQGKQYTVTFKSWDGTVINVQRVKSGEPAEPPTPPQRAGYTFTGWNPGCDRILTDTICVAQYKKTSGEYWLSHTYSAGQHTLSVSNNLSAIQVVGDMAVNGMKSQLTSVYFRDKMFELMPSCFIDCGQLKAVEIEKSTRWIDDYAFANCSSLTYVNALAYPKQTTVNVIGAHAFRNTGLIDVAIDLSGTTYDTGIGEYAFACCKNLKSARLTRSSYLGRNAFDSCTSLTSVTLPDYTSFVYPETFRGCTQLASIMLPYKIWMLSEGMFSGCSSLSSVTIEDQTGRKSILDRVGPRVFEGCSRLTQVTLPASISSLEQIDSAFLSGSSVSSIRFNGLSDNVFETDYTETKTTKLSGYVTSQSQFTTIAQDALDRNIPIIMITLHSGIDADYNDSGCSWCRGMAGQLKLPSWDAYMKKHAKEYYFVLATYDGQNSMWMSITYPKANKSPLSAAYSDTFAGGLYAKGVVVYKSESGKIYTKKLSYSRSLGATPVEGLLINDIDKTLSAYSSKSPTSEETQTVTKISKFGSPLASVTAYSMSGKEYRLSSNSTVEEYKAPDVDMTTTSGFKTGKWYYNARELKDYADQNHMPAFVEFSDAGCTPCVRFRETIYERKEFQDWVAKQNYLFCRIEVEHFTEFTTMFTQPNFVYDTWAKKSRPAIPGLIFYWNKPNGDMTWNISSYHSNPVDYVGLENMISSNLSQ